MNLFRNSTNSIREIDEEEANLIRDIKAGNKIAFGILMNKYSHFVGATVYKVLWNKNDAEDAVQETFIKVWKKIDKFKGDSKFTTWLYKIALNTAYDKLRSLAKLRQVFTKEIDIKVISLAVSNEKDIAEHVSDKDLVSIILSLSKTLSPVQRVIFSIVDIEKKKIKEAAEIMEMSQNTVKANLSHARRRIREN